jgi:hypothetical protein
MEKWIIKEIKMWDPEKYKWRLVNDYIWYCEDTRKYHFQDECGQIDSFGYDYKELALEAFHNYVKWLN